MRARLGALDLDEFNPIAEGIVDEGSFDARLVCIPVDRDAMGGEFIEQSLVVLNSKRRVGFAGRRKSLLDAEVEL